MSKVKRIVFLQVLLLSAWPAFSALAKPEPQQQAPSSFNVVHIIGLEGVKHNIKGKITVSKAMVEFSGGGSIRDLSIASIQDALTGADSQRLIRGAIGTLTIFAPYESGRFLSLFREKIDTLTISYRDSNGGLHGAIFTLPQGQAATLKQQMVADGAKTTLSAQDGK